MTPDHYLIVEAAPAIPGLEDLLADLARDGVVDAYSARQRLLGRGLALLAKGDRGKLAPLAKHLAAARVRHWLILPAPPRFAPDRLRALRTSAEALTLVGEKGEVAVERGARLVAILADLSGAAVEKSLKRLLVQNAYRGREVIDPIGDDDFRQAVLRGRPLLDIYRLGDDGAVVGAMRAYPGRFDPAGLGARRSLSAVGNLDALLDLLREFAGTLELRTDFGLATLPGCRLHRADEGPSAERENLLSLTRFGWLATQLVAQPALPAPPAVADETTQILGAVGLALGEPALAGPAVPPVGSGDAAAVPPRPTVPSPAPGRELPPPPSADELGGGTGFSLVRLGVWGGILAGIVAGLIRVEPAVLGFIWTHGVASGLLPAVLAAGCFWRGFHFLRLKRRMENTPTSKIRSLALGMVEVQGIARRRYALVAPMTQLPCVWYRLRRFRRDQKNNWHQTSSSDCGPVPFYLEDATGRVLIDPRGSAIQPQTREEGYPGGIGSWQVGGMETSEEKWVEEVVADGAPLYVLGFADVRRPGQGSLRERTIAKLQRLKGDRRALAAFDGDGDGTISSDEWDTARQAMESEALREELSAGRAPETSTIAIGRPKDRGLPFVIAAAAAEHQLPGRYGFWIIPLFLGSGLSLAWAVYLILEP